MFDAAEADLELIPDVGAERALAHQRMLRELAEIGMTLARALAVEARGEALAEDGAEDGAEGGRAGEAPAPVTGGAMRGAAGAGGARADVALRYFRIARAVRLTLALEARFAEERGHEVQRLKIQREAAARRAADAAMGRAAAEARALAESAPLREPTPKELAADLLDQAALMSDPDIDLDVLDEMYEDIAERVEAADFSRGASVAQVVQSICRALDLKPDWAAWREADWGRTPERVRRNLLGQPDPVPDLPPPPPSAPPAPTRLACPTLAASSPDTADADLGGGPGAPFSPDPAATGPPH